MNVKTIKAEQKNRKLFNVRKIVQFSSFWQKGKNLSLQISVSPNSSSLAAYHLTPGGTSFARSKADNFSKYQKN